MKFDNGLLSAGENVKLRLEKNTLVATLVDPVTNKAIVHITFGKGDFLSLYLEERALAYKEARLTGRLLFPKMVTKALKGYSANREVTGSFTWEASNELLKSFEKSLREGKISGVYRGLVHIQSSIKNGSFQVQKFGDIRDAFYIQCCKCLKLVDSYEAGKDFDAVCDAVPHVFDGELASIEPTEKKYAVTCNYCGNEIQHRVTISAEFPEDRVLFLRAWKFWKPPHAPEKPLKPVLQVPAPSKSTGQEGLVTAPSPIPPHLKEKS